MSHVSQIGFDGAAAFASAMLELAAVAPDRSLVWAVRTPGGVESGAPGVRYKRDHDRGCAIWRYSSCIPRCVGRSRLIPACGDIDSCAHVPCQSKTPISHWTGCLVVAR